MVNVRLKNFFKPEFLNRLDEDSQHQRSHDGTSQIISRPLLTWTSFLMLQPQVIVFRSLTKPEVAQIAELELLAQQVTEHSRRYNYGIVVNNLRFKKTFSRKKERGHTAAWCMKHRR